MRLLLDECLPRKLKNEFRDHQVATVPEMGWNGKRNGELIALAKGRFDVFVTVDRGVTFQQNLETADTAVMLLAAPDNRLDTLRRLIPQAREALKTIQAGDVVRIGSPSA